MSKKKWLVEQRIAGIVLLLISVFVVVFSYTGITPADKDASPILLLVPLGVYLLVTKRRIFI